MKILPPLSRKSKLLFLVVLIVSIVIPIQFWHGVWFGRQLDDGELSSYLTDFQSPRHIQHGLSQISQQIGEDDPSVSRWYPQLSSLAQHPLPQIRVQLAWVMGQDPESAVFHEALLRMLEDKDPLVGRNAALSLVRFGDNSALPVLRQMLQPWPVHAPAGGTIFFSESNGASIYRQMEFAQIRGPDGEPAPLSSDLEGWLKAVTTSGEEVEAGATVALLEPSPLHVWEALRALYLMGEAEDLELVQPFQSDLRYDKQVQRQAELTVQAISQRTPPNEERP